MATVHPPARSAGEVLAWSRGLVDPALRAATDTLPDGLKLVAGYHAGWWDAAGRPTPSDGGKALRPALAVLAAAAVGGAAADAVPGAVAVELVHNFSLLHDDVMDGDTTRRHRATAWTVFGIGPAILAGDALLTLACDVLALNAEASRMLRGAVQALLAGQDTDLALERRPDPQIADCQSMAEHKTGALIAAACAIGAVLGGGTAAQIHSLHSFGARLGLAFQHVDDLLGIWGEEAVTGKPVHSDLRSRKKSLPVVAALRSGTVAGTELAALYLRPEPLTGADLAHAAAGGEALDHLDAAAPDPLAAAELATLAALATHRDH